MPPESEAAMSRSASQRALTIVMPTIAPLPSSQRTVRRLRVRTFAAGRDARWPFEAVDAWLATRATQLFAITDESLQFPEAISPGARNLVRAGFHLVDTRSVWRPPEELIGPWDDNESDRASI